MIPNRPALTLGLAALAALSLCSTAHAGIKCWTNHEGIRECGNVVPPEFAQKGHEEISETGITIKETDRARTPEELAEQRRQAEQEAERERVHKQKVSEQLARDNVLLQTFTTEEDLTLARDGRIAVIDARIGLTRTRLDKLQSNLSELRKQAADEERSGRPVPEKLQKNIARVQRQIANNQQFIDDQERDKQALLEKFEADLQRYRALKSGQVQPGEIEEQAAAAAQSPAAESQDAQTP